MEFIHEDDRLTVEIAGAAQARVDGALYDVRTFEDGATVVSRAAEAGTPPFPSRVVWIAVDGDTRWVFVDGVVYELAAAQSSRRRRLFDDRLDFFVQLLDSFLQAPQILRETRQ